MRLCPSCRAIYRRRTDQLYSLIRNKRHCPTHLTHTLQRRLHSKWSLLRMQQIVMIRLLVWTVYSNLSSTDRRRHSSKSSDHTHSREENECCSHSSSNTIRRSKGRMS